MLFLDYLISGRKDEFINEYVKQNDQLRVKRWYHIRDSIIQLVVGIVVISMIIWTGNEAASEQIAPTVIAAFVLMTLFCNKRAYSYCRCHRSNTVVRRIYPSS